MAVARHSYTYSDLVDMPDDGQRYEILDGELVVSPSPSVRHQRTVGNIFLLLSRAEAANYGRVYLAPLDVVLDDHNVAQPDLFFITTARLSIVSEQHVPGAPDLVVEVLSPTTRSHDLGTKLGVYARYGVLWYWVVDPLVKTVQTYELREGTYRAAQLLEGDQMLSSPLFPGIMTEASTLFD